MVALQSAWDLSTGRILVVIFVFQPNCQLFGLLVTLFFSLRLSAPFETSPAWLAVLLLLLEGHWSVLSADLECLEGFPAHPCSALCLGTYSQSPVGWVKTPSVARTV